MTETSPNLTRRHVLAAAVVAATPVSAFAAQDPRIVAAGGVITEILYALGLGDRVVGVDSTSLFPAEAMKDKPNVGYVRQLSAEGILSLRPDLVIAVDGAGPPDALKLVAEAGVKVERLAEDLSEHGIVARIRTVGQLAGAGDKAETLARAVEAHFAALKLERDRMTSRKRILFVLSLQNGRATVGGRNSSADAIIRLAGGINAADTLEGYKPITDEGIIAAAPDVVLVMARGGDHALTAADLFRLPAFSATPAAATARLVAMDPLYLLGFGPRTPEAARDLMAAAR